MSIKTTSQLITDANTFLPDNTTELISAKDGRDRIIDLADSNVNKTDGGLVLGALLGYSTPITPTSNYEFSTKKYVDDSVSAVDLTPLWSKAGNTLSARGIFGSIAGIFGWDERLNNVVIGGVNNDTSRFAGTTASFATTNYSFKTLGNTDLSYGLQIQNSDNSHRAWFRNDGVFNTSAAFAINGTPLFFYDANNTLGIGVNSISSASGMNNIFLGNVCGLLSSGSNNIGGGPTAYVASTVNSTIGWGAEVFHNSTATNGSIGIGVLAWNGATGGGIAIGSTSAQYSIGGNLYAFGDGALRGATAPHIGSYGFEPGVNCDQGNSMLFSSYFNEMYFKGYKPELKAGQGTFAIQNAYIGGGTNISAASSVLSFDATLGTGNALPGNITYRYAVVQASGTTRHTKALALTMNGATGKFTFEKTINVPLTDYANNAAAVAGGLIVNDLYRTAGAVNIVI